MLQTIPFWFRAVSMRLNQPDYPWPPLEDQVDRFLTKLVGVPRGRGGVGHVGR
jgi:hypothetical protein